MPYCSRQRCEHVALVCIERQGVDYLMACSNFAYASPSTKCWFSTLQTVPLGNTFTVPNASCRLAITSPGSQSGGASHSLTIRRYCELQIQDTREDGGVSLGVRRRPSPHPAATPLYSRLDPRPCGIRDTASSRAIGTGATATNPRASAEGRRSFVRAPTTDRKDHVRQSAKP